MNTVREAILEWIAVKERMFCYCGDHEPGQCDLLLFSPSELSEVLEQHPDA